MKPIFERMKEKAEELSQSYSTKSSIQKALNYFLNNYKGLTKPLEDAEIPMDNNHQEGLMRSPAVGRKTWYGTHSEKGALAYQILFSIFESCKMNSVNPEDFLHYAVKLHHANGPPLTPWEFAQLQNQNEDLVQKTG